MSRRPPESARAAAWRVQLLASGSDLRAAEVGELARRAAAGGAAEESALSDAIEMLDAPADPREATLWRRSTGRFYTPPQTAQRLARLLLAGLSVPPRAVIDPACGTGALLLAVFDELLARWPTLGPSDAARRLWGIDNDPAAVALCEARVAQRIDYSEDHRAIERRIFVADALGSLADLPVPSAHFDAVIANPPYGNAIESETSRSARDAAAFRARFPLAARGAYDRASLFVERALQLGAPSGRVAVLVPSAWRVAPSSRTLRHAVEESHGPAYVEELDRSDFPGVSNTLSMVAWTHRRREAPDELPAGLVALGGLATIRAGMTTAEAYAVRDSVQEGGEGWRFLTAGAIDPFLVHWGRPQRYLGRTFTHPMLPFDAAPPRRAVEYRQPRVLVAGLSRRLEAVADPHGTYAAAVSVVQLFPNADRISVDELAALLNADDTRERYATSWQAAALGGVSIPVTPGRLRELLVDFSR